MTEPPSADSNPEQPTLTSQRLIAGRYRLRRVIGRGSMGVVWLGYDEVLHRQVAVKEVQLPAGMPEAEAGESRERTLREARAIAALTHPNVVAVYDVAKQGVEPFVVMELLRGRSLAQLTIQLGTLNAEQLAVVADAIAAGLDTAHRRGITHRDVKPGNVLVGEDGQVKLTDFGISRNVSEVTMTNSGLILGTPAYMAPEVAAGGEVTTAADLWSFGATLFAAVEGRPPYDAGDPLATVNEVVHGEIPRVADDASLADVITGLMAKDPDQRMTVLEVRRRIRPLLPEFGRTVFPPDESEVDAGPVDNKPTAHLGTPAAQVAAPPARLAADPGPLPWAVSSAAGRPVARSAAPLAPMPGPLPFMPQPPVHVVRRRRSPAMLALLALVAVVLFAAAAGGGFAATRNLAGRPLLPPPAATTTTTVPSAPLVLSFVTVTAGAPVLNGTDDGHFTVKVPAGWTKFVEQRDSRTTPNSELPDSTVVRWVKQDGTAEVSVERFHGDESAPAPQDYLNALRDNDSAGALLQSDSTLFLFRTGGDTLRSTYITFTTPPGGTDLWVLSVTVPTDQEHSGVLDLFDKISPTFHVAG
ncbi:MAG TPA: serine/threonine-protein kinase [Pseudonocardiaceae bacterium]|nr:serine/threonine-protein kinase [Pseudonocardiaceae bacterium]